MILLRCCTQYTSKFGKFCVDHNKLQKILKKMGISDHVTCLLINLYAGQEKTEPDVEQQTGSKLGVRQGCMLSPCLYNLYAEYVSSEMLGWKNHKLESRLQGEVSTTSDTQMIPF